MFEYQRHALNIKRLLPGELELSRTYIILRIFVTHGSELDVLRIISVTEPQFCSLIEDIFHLLDDIR